MGRMERLSIELPEEVKEIVEQAVASGEFASASEMVASAVESWRSSKLIYGRTVEEWRVLIAEADEDEELIDGEDAFRQIAEEFKKSLGDRD